MEKQHKEPASTAEKESSSESSSESTRVAKRRKRLSTAEERIKRDLAPMMYGFGDVPRPASESIDVLYDMVQEFVGTVTHKGLETEQIQLKRYRSTNKSLTHKPLVWSIRRDRRLHERIIELLASHKTIQATKKLIKENQDQEDSDDDDP
jgi:hypothetical protein